MSSNSRIACFRSALPASVLAVALVATVIGSSGLASTRHAHAEAAQPGPHGQYAPLTDEHLKELLHHLMAKVGDEQRSRLVEIARRAKPEFDSFEHRSRLARAPRRDVLLADVIDRQALERIRAAEMQVAQERSLRVDQLLVDMASVLTPQQRAAFLTELRSPAH